MQNVESDESTFELFLGIMDVVSKEEKDHPRCYQCKDQRCGGSVSARAVGNLHICEGLVNAESCIKATFCTCYNSVAS